MVCRVPAPVYVQLYQLVAILIGVVGNGFVIYASKQYSTFNLDSNTIFLVRHLGYADVAILLLGFLPANFMFVHGFEDTTDAFNAICTIQGICMNIFGLSALSITAGISIHRLLRCTQPQVIARLRRNMMLGIVSACYIGAATVAVLVMVIPPRLQYRYDNGYYSCIGHYNGDNAENNQKQQTLASISRGVGMTLSALFFIIIILINILLHHFSKKKLARHKGSTSKKHRTSRYRTMTTHSISALLVLTWLPFATTFFITITQESSDPTMIECQHDSTVRMVSTCVINFYLLNFVLNPFLYCITNINFMKFVIKLIKRRCNDKLCSAFWSRITTDLDISTNVSTVDNGLERSNSNNCSPPGDPVDKVFSNTLTVPDSSARKKLSCHSSSVIDSGSYIQEGSTKNKIFVTNCDANGNQHSNNVIDPDNIVECEVPKHKKTSNKSSKADNKVHKAKESGKNKENEKKTKEEKKVPASKSLETSEQAIPPLPVPDCHIQIDIVEYAGGKSI